MVQIAGCRQRTCSRRRFVNKMIPTRFKHGCHAPYRTDFNDGHGPLNGNRKSVDIRFSSPVLARLLFRFLLKDRQTSRQELHQSLRPKAFRNVLKRHCQPTVDCNREKDYNFYVPPRPFPALAPSTPVHFVFVFFVSMFFLKGHQLPLHTPMFLQLVMFPTNERYAYRVAMPQSILKNAKQVLGPLFQGVRYVRITALMAQVSP